MIINVKSGNKYDVYIGRANKTYNLSPSKWANPFVIGVDGERGQVIDKYRLWLNTQPDLLEALPELKGKTLGCWCNHPFQACHGAVLEDLANSFFVKNWFSNMLPMETPLVYQGISYDTVENFYQAMKMPKNRTDLRFEIAGMEARKAKTAVRDKEKFPWDKEWTKEKSLKVMQHALNHKFAFGNGWHGLLMKTEDWPITEWTNWRDVFWGKDLHTRKGENHLGKMLEQIRENSKNI